MTGTTEEKTPEELAWAGCALSMCVFLTNDETGGACLVTNSKTDGMNDAFRMRIGGSTPRAWSRSFAKKLLRDSNKDVPDLLRLMGIDKPHGRSLWYYEGRDDIVALIRASWPWLIPAAQKRARWAGLAPMD